jgi:hypothetical protein
MALVTGEELAVALDLAYDPEDPDLVLDQVAEAADDIVAALLTDGAYELEPAPCKEAALSVGVELYQARTAAGGQPVSVDFTPGPYRLSVWLTKRVHALIWPYANVNGWVG